MGGQKPPMGVPGGARGVPGGHTISHNSECSFYEVKVKNPSQNIKKTKAPAPRQHNCLCFAIHASHHKWPKKLQQQPTPWELIVW